MPKDLYDLLACPTCKVAVEKQGETLLCPQCQQSYPIVGGVPVLFPDGSIPQFVHQHDLGVRTDYSNWIYRCVLQSLPTSSITLDLGAGNMALNFPHVIRMDVTLTPYVDVVGDAHALPFLPGVFDFVFSLAVIEHLRQPFVAAEQMYRVLRLGGYVYGECNFTFPYHGYPHHYFGASKEGMEQIFAPFVNLRCSLAPFQMPSFAIRSVLAIYREHLGKDGEPDVQNLHELIQNLIDQPLGLYDSRFSEHDALHSTPAGVFFFGLKSPDGTSEVIPAPVQAAWEVSSALQARFPQKLNLGVPENIMRWALSEGRQQDPALAQWFDGG